MIPCVQLRYVEAAMRSPTPRPAPPTGNLLLASLPQSELRELQAQLEYFPLPLGRTLHEPGMPLTHAYFPTAGILSLLYINDSGATAEVAVTGNEGLTGIGIVLGTAKTTYRAVVQAAGAAYRLPAGAMKARFEAGGAFRQLMLAYLQCFIVQLSQTAICNLHHSVDQRFCLWLLLCLERLHAEEIEMTHELIATMIGVRRQGVTEAAKRLQARGIIRYSRGRITVLEHGELEKAACECYQVVKRQLRALLPGAHAAP
jgi:CRP-like cAMP-binding protein